SSSLSAGGGAATAGTRTVGALEWVTPGRAGARFVRDLPDGVLVAGHGGLRFQPLLLPVLAAGHRSLWFFRRDPADGRSPAARSPTGPRPLSDDPRGPSVVGRRRTVLPGGGRTMSPPCRSFLVMTLAV